VFLSLENWSEFEEFEEGLYMQAREALEFHKLRIMAGSGGSEDQNADRNANSKNS
jgi:hypothetical protein